MLTYEDLPCWSRLEFDPRAVALDILIHEDAAHMLSDAAMMRRARPEEFISSGKTYGVNGCLQHHDDRSKTGFIRLRLDPPVVRKNREEKCTHCRGTGKDKTVYNHKCMWCDGEKFPVYYDYKVATDMSETLCSLLHTMHAYALGGDSGKKTTSSDFQIISVNIGVRDGFYPICGTYSPRFIEWLRTFCPFSSGDKRFAKVVDAMALVWAKMEGGKIHDPLMKGQFWLNGYESGWLNISCPGDACGINPSHPHVDGTRREGYEFSTHNPDTLLQQFSLLAGLAALEMMCRRGTNANVSSP